MADDEYDDMVERILDEDVDPNSVSEADIRNDLNQSNTSQIGGDNVDIVLENTLTVDDIDEAVGGLDETPTSSELGAVVDGVEDERVGSDERVRNVEDLASETYATKEDIDVALDEVTETEDRGYVSKEDVADAVGLVEEQKEVVGSDPVETTARDIGAPSETDVNRAASSAVRDADTVEVQEVVDGSDSSTPVSTLRDENGDPAAVIGQTNAAERVADEVGVEAVAPDEVDVSVRKTGRSSATVEVEGVRAGEVDI